MKFLKNCIHSLKKEFQREKFGFVHTPLDDFVKSQWQHNNKSMVYLIYRWFLAIFFTFVVLESMIDPDDDTNFWLYFIYMTNWAIMLCMLTNLYAAILVTIWYFGPKVEDGVENLGSLKSSFRIYWGMHTNILVVSIVITIIYWGILYNAEEDILSATNILKHAFNSIFMFLDFLIVAHPLRLKHMLLPVSFGFIYAIFSVIYKLCGGQNEKGQPYIYKVLDWNMPLKAASTLVGVLILCCCITVILFTIFKLRRLLSRRIKNGSFNLPTTTAPDVTMKPIGGGRKLSPSDISVVLDNNEGQSNPTFSKSSEDITRQ